MSKKDNNHAILFTNNNKVNSNHPDYKGSFELNGKKGQAAAWIKTAKNNQKYLSISFQDSNDKPAENKINESKSLWSKIVNKQTIPLEESVQTHKKINKEKEKITKQRDGRWWSLEVEEEAERVAMEKKNLNNAIKQAKDPGKTTVELGEGEKTKQTFLKRFLKNRW